MSTIHGRRLLNEVNLWVAMPLGHLEASVAIVIADNDFVDE